MEGILKSDGVSSSDSAAFEPFLNTIIHDWSRTVTALAFTLVPIFFVLDYFTMPLELLPRFAVYRAIGTIVPVLQYFALRRTRPGKLSYVHGYLVSLFVGGAIAIMTVELGGFDSRYYAGLNLVIIGVNILLPWPPLHSAINGVLTIAFYLAANLLFPHPFDTGNCIGNLFFMSATVIIAVTINYVRHKLIRDEFFLRAELKRARDALWSEMEIAHKIQTSLLPDVGRIGNYRVAARMIPATEVGGDYYDIIETLSGERWLAIGDVSGHGVESGLIMMMTQTSIFTMVNSSTGLMPSRVIEYVNNAIKKNVSRMASSRYTTINAIRLETNRLTVAGKHQDIFVHRGETGLVDIIPTVGTWIGLVERIEGSCKDLTIPLGVGDTVLLFTDGVTEAMNEDHELFGDERLAALFRQHAQLPPAEIIEAILHEVQDFQLEQDDDMTLLVLRREA